MSENVVINEDTYDVDAIVVEGDDGEQKAFYPDAVRYNKQTLTEEQQAQARENISAASAEELKDLEIPKKLADLTEDKEHRVVTDTEKENWNNKSDFSGNYNDLKNKPSIPGNTNQLENGAGFITDAAINEHNVSVGAHNDIRVLIEELTKRLNAVVDSEDVDLDQLSELVAYIKSNRALIEEVTTAKVNVIDIIDNLTTSDSKKPLSAKQGVVLKALIDAISVPTLLSELVDDSTHRLVTDAEKQTWNEKSDFSGNYSDLKGSPTIPSKTSQLVNDSNFLTEHQDLSAYAKKTEIPKTPSDIGAEESGTADSKVKEHNTNAEAHNDIRLLIEGLTSRLNALANSDDTTLDQMAEVVAYIKSNRTLIESVTTDKVSVSAIINNLTTNVANQPLSAAQGVVLKGLIDALQTAVNAAAKAADLNSHTGNTTAHITDAERAAWNAKQPAGNYALKSELPTKTSQLTDDVGFAKQTDVDNLSEEVVALVEEQRPNSVYHVEHINVNPDGEWETGRSYMQGGTPKIGDLIIRSTETGFLIFKIKEVTDDYCFADLLFNSEEYLTEQDISDKANKSDAETWTFTLEDGSTVTKKVVLA